MVKVTVIGGGLAGSEAAFQLAMRSIDVDLHEMRPDIRTPAHETGNLAELVCSNSLKSLGEHNAHGVLKRELFSLGSALLPIAMGCRVPAGSALAVDRASFSAGVEAALTAFDGTGGKGRVTIKRAEAAGIDESMGPVILATGPMTSDSMIKWLGKRLPGNLFFFDAVAPVIEIESIDMSVAFRASRYGKNLGDPGDGIAGKAASDETVKGTGEDADPGAYMNCPMNEEEYLAFHAALTGAQRALVRDFDKGSLFEGCMPVEELADRGFDTLRFGPMKPVGLNDPRSGRRPFAVVQLRQDNNSGTLFNMVGFQTRLTHPEQKRVFSMIPGLGAARFARYGVMHRNTYFDGPRVLDGFLAIPSICRDREVGPVLAAGQITGVEGYVESIATGFLAGVNMARIVSKRSPVRLPVETMVGAMISYVSGGAKGRFSPMPANFGLLPPLAEKIRKSRRGGAKESRKEMMAARCAEFLAGFIDSHPDFFPDPPQ